MPTVFDEFNRSIHDFVSRPENQRLRAGTGSYSTPFRGTLFKHADSAAAASALATQPVDVLWLGTNPDVPASVEKILGPVQADGDFDGFQQQRLCGMLGDQDWRSTPPIAGRDPLTRPTRGWAVYSAALARVTAVERVAMANFVPWGSASSAAFWEPMRRDHPALLQRAVQFADELNAAITLALRPRLIVMPRSLSDCRELRETAIGRFTTTAVSHEITKLGKRTFRFATGEIERGGARWKVVALPHPASLRYSKEHRAMIVDGVSEVLRAAIA